MICSLVEIDKIILNEAEKCGFRVSTDTRKGVSGSLYFALKGEKFDGSKFIEEALTKGAVGAITDNPEVRGERIYFVRDSLKTLQNLAKTYRERFQIPVLAIGGSNGKTTTRELISETLQTRYRIHSSRDNFNNHIGLPLSILSMGLATEVGVFEIGANHPGEHTELLNILQPTMVLVTNNGLDHLEGFGSPEGVRKANKEIFNWSRERGGKAFVNKKMSDLEEDSDGLKRVFYPEFEIKVENPSPLALSFGGNSYLTNLAGGYNLDNVYSAIAIGKFFGIETKSALEAIRPYQPSANRSQLISLRDMSVILDCYNANPSSMRLSLESFIKSTTSPRGVILGDMLELGSYADEEHRKIVEFVSSHHLEQIVFIGEHFKKALEGFAFKFQWFANANEAEVWFNEQNFSGFSFLLKGSRGVKVEQVLGLC